MVVGLTGGIGSGKSTVLGFFKEYNVQIFIADIEAKKIMNSNNELKNEIKVLFGDQAYNKNELDRKYIASIVFNEKEKLEALNNLVHPAVKLKFEKFKSFHKGKIIIYEAAILFESGTAKNCDYIITVTANIEDRIKRLVKRDLSTKDEIESRMRNQMNDDYKIIRSHFVIKNSDLISTKDQVNTVYKILNSINKRYKIS